MSSDKGFGDEDTMSLDALFLGYEPRYLCRRKSSVVVPPPKYRGHPGIAARDPGVLCIYIFRFCVT